MENAKRDMSYIDADTLLENITVNGQLMYTTVNQNIKKLLGFQNKVEPIREKVKSVYKTAAAAATSIKNSRAMSMARRFSKTVTNAIPHPWLDQKDQEDQEDQKEFYGLFPGSIGGKRRKQTKKHTRNLRKTAKKYRHKMTQDKKPVKRHRGRHTRRH